MSSPNKSVDGAISGPISLAKVRNILKLSADVSCLGTAQCILLAKVADLFTADLINAAYIRSTSKFVDYQDLCEVVHENDGFDFIHPLIPKQMTYKEYKEWLSKRDDDSSIQPRVDPGVVSQQGIKKKVIKKNEVTKKLKPSKDSKSKSKILSPIKKLSPVQKPVVNSSNKKQMKDNEQNGIQKYFVKLNKL